MDKNAAYPKATMNLKGKELSGGGTAAEQVLNNRIEQDHRFTKWLVKPGRIQNHSTQQDEQSKDMKLC